MPPSVVGAFIIVSCQLELVGLMQSTIWFYLVFVDLGVEALANDKKEILSDSVIFAKRVMALTNFFRFNSPSILQI